MATRNENFLPERQNQSTKFEKPTEIQPSINNNNNIVESVRAQTYTDEPGRRPEQNRCEKIENQKNFPRKAPIVGWQNGSPTVFPSSPCTPGSEAYDRPNCLSPGTFVSSRSTGIYQDNTEDLSLADEHLLETTTPSHTIGRSVASLTPDKDTFLTTSDLRSKDISIGDELDKVDLHSPDTDCTDPAPTSSESFNTKDSSTEKSARDDLTTDSASSKERLLKEDRIKFGENCQLIIPETIITSNPGYHHGGSRDSIDSDSILDLEDASEKGKRKPKVPDGGWGWVVVLASLVISMIADGVSFSFGLLYIEFLNEFGASKSKTAWIGSLFMAVPLLSGPIMSALVDRYGCRRMTIAGGLIAGTGFVLSSFSNTIEVMYLTFGVIAGLGLGLCYVTAVVSIAYWFDKKRTLAVGLGACGTGIGTFVYAPMTTYFIDEYGWRGTCLLLAGTFFNMIVCGSVMRDPEWWILEQRKQSAVTPKKSIARSECGRSSGSHSVEFPGVEELRRLLKSGQAPEYLLQSLSTSTAAPNNDESNEAFRSVVNLPTFIKQSEKKWYSELVDLLKGMVDFSMFLELHFLLMSLSTILLFIWFIVPYFYLAEHLTRNGYTESDAANLLSIIGITNTIGMIGLGWAGDQPWMNVSKTFSWCLAACGLATIFMSICTTNYVLLMATSAAFGLFFASSFSFTPVILVELIPLERFTTAYGLTLLCQGIGNLVGPPLAGWLFDMTDSWDLSFYMAGGWIILSGVFVGLIPYTKNRKIWGEGPVEMEMERDRDSLA